MKIKFLGTAAAEAVPGVFCDCEICKKSRKEGGKNVRTRSQAIVDDKILIDLPAETYMHSIIHNIELSKIKTCIITHCHADHFYPAELWSRGIGPAPVIENKEPLTIYATKSGYQKAVSSVIEFGLDDCERVKTQKINPFEPFFAEGYKITPLKALHDPTTDPVIYLIEKDGKTLLYAHDTGFFPDETVEYLKKSGVKLDFATFDCCAAIFTDENYGEGGHLNLIGAKKMRDLLKSNGNITDNTVCVVNHFSHNAIPLHEELEKIAEKDGFIASYDGMEIEF